MKLKSLKLKNFKGIKSLELVANGQDLRIYGDNATGKTTVYDAFLWLLFDKDSQNRSDFAIKTLNKNGEPIHHLDHEVEGVFEVDGDTVELRKVYREKWVKPRGKVEQEFSGHETDHFIDGVPVKKNEFVARVGQIAPEDQFKLLTSPTYFNEQLGWQKRREMLLEVCGDVTDEDVIKSNEALAKLPGILGKRSLKDHKKVITARRTEINKELDRIPVRIDEVTSGLPDISAIENPTAIETDLEKLTKAKAAKESELTSLLSGGNQGEIKRQMAEIEAQMLTIETAYKWEHAKKVGEVESNIKVCQDAIRDVQRKISSKTDDLEHSQERIKATEKRMTELRDKWHEVNAWESQSKANETCPTCGQNLPPEKVQETKERLLAEFNTTKALTLEQINEEGKAKKSELEKTLLAIKDLEKEIADLESRLDLLAEDNAKLNADVAKLNATFDDYKDLPEYKKLVTEKDKLQKALDGDQLAIEPEKERIEAEIKSLNEAADAILKAKANLELHQQGEKRIRELEAQQTALATEFEKLEQELYLIELFIRTKVGLLTERINSKFKFARFKLFEEQVNGGLAEVCETTYNGVPYSSGLNNGARINIGLDIINTLSEHFGFSAPVFIDNREAVTELIDVNTQVISLIVSEQDKTLRIEGPDKESVQQSLFEEAI